MDRRKVLVIDVDDSLAREMSEKLKDYPIDVISTTGGDALAKLEEHPDLGLILVVEQNDVGSLKSIKLIETIRETYTGPMLAIAPSKEAGRFMVLAGCTSSRFKSGVHIDVLSFFHMD